jgi:hypothetical protein
MNIRLAEDRIELPIDGFFLQSFNSLFHMKKYCFPQLFNGFST